MCFKAKTGAVFQKQPIFLPDNRKVIWQASDSSLSKELHGQNIKRDTLYSILTLCLSKRGRKILLKYWEEKGGKFERGSSKAWIQALDWISTQRPFKLSLLKARADCVIVIAAISVWET